MPPFDREGALKAAEKALRQGRIDAAITEYVRIIEAQPRDWNSANALGDLYVRANQLDKGIAQYTRIADHLNEEGFYPKAAALYKKILKLKPDEEHALLQSGEIAARLGLLADAKTTFKTIADRRRGRGDKKGAAEMSIRIGTLDPEDLDSRLGAAKAAVEIGDTPTAIREYAEVGAKFDKQNRPAEAMAAYQAAYDLNPQDDALRSRLLQGYLTAGNVDRATALAATQEELKQLVSVLENAGRQDDVLRVLETIVERDPADIEVRARLAQAYFAKGDLVRARGFLSLETAGNNPALLLTLAELELQGSRYEEGREAVVKALTLDPSARETVVALGCRLAETSPEAGYPCIDAVADAALAEHDYAAAAAALHEFVTRVRYHVVALMRLVDICVDGGLEATMYEAQAQLADAYLEVGRGLEARIISEDLVAREPWNRANIERFRRALVMLGERDPDAIIAERLSGESPFLATDKMDLNEGLTFEEPEPIAAPAPPPPPARSQRPATPPVEEEIDLDAVLEEPAAPAAAAAKPRSSDHVFKEMRDEAGRSSAEEAAAEQYRLALTYRELGMVDDAVKALEAAARSPRQRFDACSLLGRLYVDSSELAKAVDWFERAAEAPAPTPDASRALLYDLGETLERLGEQARALAVYVELESESGGYRDVANRIERLSKVQAKG
jgi:tetratricopeptide (TPR) repeat protein